MDCRYIVCIEKNTQDVTKSKYRPYSDGDSVYYSSDEQEEAPEEAQGASCDEEMVLSDWLTYYYNY